MMRVNWRRAFVCSCSLTPQETWLATSGSCLSDFPTIAGCTLELSQTNLLLLSRCVKCFVTAAGHVTGRNERIKTMFMSISVIKNYKHQKQKLAWWDKGSLWCEQSNNTTISFMLRNKSWSAPPTTGLKSGARWKEIAYLKFLFNFAISKVMSRIKSLETKEWGSSGGYVADLVYPLTLPWDVGYRIQYNLNKNQLYFHILRSKKN